MKNSIVAISDRGQVTIPKGVRAQIIDGVQYFTCQMKGSSIVLEPLQTRDEFLEELEEARKDWKKKGGLTVKEMGKKFNIKS